MLVYLNERMNSIRNLRWEIGGTLPENIQSKLNESEKTFFDDYNRSLGRYIQSIGDIDLTNNLKVPPQQLYIEVHVLQDFGTLEMEDGTTLVLRKNNRVYLPRSEADPLVKQGILEHISG
eukprot:TRINITY_DN2506_c0_g1_i1.p1 TRINITY_DN2506_c0_g1~~TRINITY_DN2506_c0_g1_i1.p1  ORF type:complete len:120 (+),score=31.78 TRINITY_DN2506_c0_g1_i1:296-655(+)